MVADPAEADLLLVPTFPAPKKGAQWDAICDRFPEIGHRIPHLTERNAHRHLLVLGKAAGWSLCKIIIVFNQDTDIDPSHIHGFLWLILLQHLAY